MLEKHADDVKLAFKNFPLRNHRFAAKAAMAALAAERQGKFWEYHDKLFDNYSTLHDTKLVQLAQSLDLNVEQFQKDINDPKLQTRINQDIQDGNDAGVRGTPTIFVNGKRLKIRSLEEFSAIIQKELAKKRK